ncbi:ATP-binding protein [Draconibacterium sp. IB214405]|uniref:hybrid sensor histidine kinase/response regulator n=1 Tax=Draconibacterium sp. IB214405 TaxID=3097352 RepID=UPI002A0B9598|nr:ATP-binding protein [Draconibacterium sp. IB214405]MDX8338291.1 ATP-binding protein [Draconibacterium sp. IB214405]
MKRVKIEIPVILLTIVIISLLGFSGNFVYKSLSEIVNSMLSESKPDNTLILVKDVALELNETENMVKLYSLSNNNDYLDNYRSVNESLDTKFEELQSIYNIDSTRQMLIDSVLILAQQKVVVWEKILNLHLSRGNEHEAFNQYVETLDTVLSVQDTIHFEEPEQRGFFKRVFGKKQEPPTPVIVDRTVEKQRLQQEIQSLEKELKQRNQRMSSAEAVYMRKNFEISESLSTIITALERQEEESFLRQSQEAELLANETYERLSYFALSVLLLLLLVLILFFRDLRKSRSHQKVLRKAKTHAENLARTKELFVATVSHEMRTPVNAIYGLSEQLLQKHHDEKTQEDLRVIFDSTKHLAELVNDTFDFSRLEKQNIQLIPVHFALDELLHKIELYNKSSVEAKNISFHIENSVKNDLVLFGDEGRLKQILNNLVTNAVKFTDEGEVKLAVTAKEQKKQILLDFEISDTGIGIPKESQERIFEDFVQLDTDINKKAGGTGLGLYIVKKLVDLLDGKITVESEVNKGTHFFVSIPLQKGDSTKIQQTFRSFDTPEVLKGQTVLIVDDEAFNRHLLKSILNKWKVDFDEAENGQEAVELAAKNNYVLILMDIRMPVMDGIEAARTIKQTGHKARIISLSANSDSTNQSEKNVFDSALKKPFDEASLYNIICNTVDEKPAQVNSKQEAKLLYQPDLTELKRMGNDDPGFLKEMIDLFLKTSEASMQSIDKNLGDQNYEAIAELAHKLASPVKYMNVTGVYNTIKELEQLAKNGNGGTVIEEKAAQLHTGIEALNKELETLLNEKFE